MSTTLGRAVLAASTLDELLAALREHEGEHDEGDLPELPTFGGSAPEDTDGVFSWDAGRLLVFEGGLDEQNAYTDSRRWRIINREDAA